MLRFFELIVLPIRNGWVAGVPRTWNIVFLDQRSVHGSYGGVELVFTVEMDHDEVEITVLDDRGQHEDIKVFSYEDVVYIRQWRETRDCYNLVTVSPEMYVELMKAYQSSEGAYVTSLTRTLSEDS